MPHKITFVDGMTDGNLILRVISRTSAMTYKILHKTFTRARELNVEAVAEGSVLPFTANGVGSPPS